MRRAVYCATALAALIGCSFALGAQDHSHHAMRVTAAGVVMNENHNTLPRGCDAISQDIAFTIRAGQRYATEPGMIYGLSQYEVAVPACSRIAVTFVNEDEIRHQWMVHGLPKYLYPAGMFHIEAAGGAEQRGVFIVPPEPRSYLIHCDIAQHMEKGMRGQLLVAGGNGDLWAVPGLTDAFLRKSYWPTATTFWLSLGVLTLIATWLSQKFGH